MITHIERLLLLSSRITFTLYALATPLHPTGHHCIFEGEDGGDDLTANAEPTAAVRAAVPMTLPAHFQYLYLISPGAENKVRPPEFLPCIFSPKPNKHTEYTMAKTTEQVADKTFQDLEAATAETGGFSLFHLLTFGSIAASIYLFSQGRKQDGIFVGLWAPTFEALRSSFGRG